MKTSSRRRGPDVPVALLPGLAIAGLGVGLCWLTGAAVAWWPVTWFSAGAMIYSLDRWADAGPDALADRKRRDWLRVGDGACCWLLLGGIGVLAPPMLAGEWLLATIIAGGVLVALNYSVRLPGMPVRFRELPVVKSLLPAPAVVGAVLVLPAVRSGVEAGLLAAWTAWAWAIVQVNVWLCDWRDRRVDARTGLQSLVGVLGDAGARRLTGVFVAASWMAAVVVGMLMPEIWIVLLTVTGYFSVLAWRVTAGGRWRSFELWVDGGLLLPAFVALLVKVA